MPGTKRIVRRFFACISISGKDPMVTYEIGLPIESKIIQVTLEESLESRITKYSDTAIEPLDFGT